MDERSAEHRVCYRCVIAGRVQGVFFRASTREQAMRLGLTGYARNLSDGRVEVLACGKASAVAQLRDWLRVGPALAEVTGLVCEPLNYQEQTGFIIE
ncbi:acylphosphatase [Thermochromatium tepidum]|uniref:Acylphosphatase n=1 Tax=Thermochromatium tepidum ATCC 43061 TaxID=316276 RepID=A0A6I6DZI4_THETI|nr:acylphosphatase [Thermochromatium tepidum]QGU33024.1 acylphosphatase [Thermochromatium tepidum ATCC 43061]